MPNFAKRAHKKLQDQLEPGEEFVFAGVAQPRGSFSRAVSDDLTSISRAVVRSAREKRAERDGTIADRIPRSNGYLSVTTRRVVWLDQGKLLWPTREIVAAFLPDEIRDATRLTDKGGNHELRLRFTDGSRSSLLVHKSQKPRELVAAIDSLISGNST